MLKSKSTYGYLTLILGALFTGVVSTTLISFLPLSKAGLLLLIPTTTLTLMAMVIYNYRYRTSELFEVFLLPLLGTTIFVQSVVVAGVNISLSDIYLVVMTLALLILNTKKVQIPMKFLIFPIAYLFYCFLSLTWAVDSSKSLAPLIQYIEFMILSSLIFYNIQRQTTLVKVIEGYVLFSSLLAFVALIAAVAQGALSGGPLYIFGFHKNALGAIVGNCLPLSIGLLIYYKDNKKKSILLLGATTLCALVLLLSASRGSMLGAAAGIIVVLYMVRKMRMLLITSLLGAALLWIFTTYISPEFLSSMTDFERGSSAYSRVIAYEDVINKIQQSPWIGHGLGNYLIEIPSIGFTQDDPNNVFLLNLVEIGFLGLLLFSFILLSVFRTALINRSKFKGEPKLLILSAIFIGGFISQLVHIQVDVSWVRGTGLFMFANVGMLLCLRYRDIERAPDK